MENVGVKAVVENAQRAIKDAINFSDALEQIDKQSTQTAQSATKALSPLKKQQSEIGKTSKATKSWGEVLLNKLNPALGNMASEVKGGIAPLGQMVGASSAATASLQTFAMQALVVLGVVTALAIGFAAFAKAASRGAQLQDQAVAFSNIAGGAQQAQAALVNLRQDTHGTISDFELMRLTVLALQGTTSDFRQVVASDMGKIIDATNRVSRATGQSADQIREKFLFGLRRQSKLLLDDVGVMVDAEFANRMYADSLGLTVDALTEQQKQAAFAREAILQLADVSEEIGGGSPITTFFAQLSASIQNLKDQMALLLSYAFEPFAERLAPIIAGFNELSSVVIPVLASVVKALADIWAASFDTMMFVMSPLIAVLKLLAGSVLPYVAAAFILIADAAGWVAQQISKIFGFIRNIINEVFGGVLNDIDGFVALAAYNLAYGGALIMGGFAKGFLKGGKQAIDAAAWIAEQIANFLVGESPPPKGALSKIDEGGYNVAVAWMTGFAKGALGMVDTLATNVNNRLGDIKAFTENQVASGFRQLDIALLPFQEHLELVKADLQAINGLVAPALDKFEKQREQVLKAFGKGEAGAEQVRQLDKQVSMLRDMKRQDDARLADAELMLAVGEAAQAQERALLNIQKRRLELFKTEEVTPDATDPLGGLLGGGGSGSSGAEKAMKDAAEKALSGAKEAVEEATSGGGFALDGGDFAKSLLDNAAIDRAKAVIKSGISAGLADSGFTDARGEFQESANNLALQGARLASANPEQVFSDKFSGITNALTQTLADIKKEIDSFDPVTALTEKFLNLSNGVAPHISTFRTTVEGGINSVKTTLSSVSFDTFLAPFAEGGAFRSVLTSLFGEGMLLGENGMVMTAFNAIFGTEGLFASAFGEDGYITQLFSGDTGIGTSISDVFTTITDELDNLKTSFDTNLLSIRNAIILEMLAPLSPFQSLKTAADDVIGHVTGAFLDFATNQLQSALSTLGNALMSYFVQPVISAANSILTAIESAIRNAWNALGVAQVAIRAAGVDLGGFTIPKLDNMIMGAATGALNHQGLTLVGEKGAELVNIGRPSTIFPANATRALMNMAAMPQYVQGGGMSNNQSTVNNNRSVVNNISVSSDNEAMFMMRRMEARL